MGMQKLNRMPKDAFHYPRYAIPQFDDTTAALPTTFYWCSVVSIGLSRTIFKINGKICSYAHTKFPPPYIQCPTHVFRWNFVMAVGLKELKDAHIRLRKV